MKIACVLALLLSCSVLATVHGSRIQDILSKIKGSGRRNGYDFVEDRGCSSTSKVAAVFSLSQASPASCLASPVAALYSRLFIITAEGLSCKPRSYWSISPASTSASSKSNPEVPFSYPASPAVQWRDAAGKAQTFQSWGTEMSRRQDSSPQAPWAMRGADLTPLRNTTEGVMKMLPRLLPAQYALFVNSTATNLAPYNITLTAQGFQAFLANTGCTYTWQVAAGSWAGFTSTNSVSARPSADPSKPRTWSSSMAFTLLCPAGAALLRQQCTMCEQAKNEVSLAVASTSCMRCPPGTTAGDGGRACLPVCANISTTALGTQNFYNAKRDPAGACSPAKCPAGSWHSLNRDMCIASQNGALCVAASTASNSSSASRPACKAPAAAGTSAAAAGGVGGVGGAALQLASFKADGAACQPVKQLAQWLAASKRLSFMGWDLGGDFSAAAAADAAAAGIRSQGIVWQLLGSWNASSVPLRPADDCSGTSRGPGPQAALTHFSDALDTNALLFSTVLATGRNRTARNLPAQVLPRSEDTAGYSIIAQPGATAGTITTTWFRDNTVEADCMLTALSGTITPQESATCQLDFKVVGGSVLGVAAAAGSCPAGFHAVKQSQGSSSSSSAGLVSCVACGPGQVFDTAAASCKSCSGQQTWQGWWRDVAACSSCSSRASNGGIAGVGNWWCAGQRSVGWPRWNSA